MQTWQRRDASRRTVVGHRLGQPGLPATRRCCRALPHILGGGGTLPRLIPQYYLYNPTRRGGYMASGRRRDSWTQGRSRYILRADEDSSEWASCAAVAKRVSSVTSLRNPHHPNDVEA